MKYKQGDIILEEQFEPGLKHALFSNFSKYTDAFLELSDNAVSNRIPKKTLTINILVSSRSLEITNHGGYGMNIEDLDNFLKWGKIKSRRPTDLGAYSQGGKSAMGYLGTSMTIIACPRGGKEAYRLEDDDLHDYKLKKYRVMKLNSESGEGYVKIEVGGLRRKINDGELKEILTNTYRPLIKNQEIIIQYNGERLAVQPFPVESKIYNFSFSVKNSSNNFNKVYGWVGYLGTRSGLKGGLRCYKLGRLICSREFFGHPDASYKQTLNFLFGEAYLDQIPVTTNKTDFDRDSDEWLETKEKMNEILKPFIDELLGRDIQEPSDEERERVKQAKDIVAELMKLRKKELKGTAGVTGISFGQKSPETEGENQDHTHDPTRRKNQPKTPPPPNAKGRRRRLKEFMNWDIRPMEESLRSIIEEKKKKKFLIINNLFSGYKAAKGNLLYLIETAAIQLSKPDAGEKITTEEYIADFDDLYSFFCSNLEKVKENLKNKRKN